MNHIATINGLCDGISVLETNKNEQPSFHEDMLYNKDTTFDDIWHSYHDEGFTFSEYRVDDFGEAITLTSLTTATLSESTFDLF